MADILVKFRVRRGTAAQWAVQNPVLFSGEPGWETDTKVLRIGDGVSAFTSLKRFASIEDIDTSVLLTKTSNLAGMSNVAAARTNLGATATGSSLFTAADVAAARAAIGAPPAPQSAAGLGQWTLFYAPLGTEAVLLAGGTWAYFSIPFSPQGNLVGGGLANVAAGGTVVGAANASVMYVVLCWRVI